MTDAVPSVTKQGYKVDLMKSIAGGYNAGILRHNLIPNGETWLCTRTIDYDPRDMSKHRFRLTWQRPCDPAGNDGFTMQPVMPVEIEGLEEGHHAEDPRVIVAPWGGIYIVFSESIDFPVTPVRMRVAVISGDLGVAKLLPLLEYGGNGISHQKNWQFFFIGDRMFFSFWPYPHRVVEVDPVKWRVIQEWNELSVNPYVWQFGPLAGGTPPVPWRGQMVSFYHGKMPHPNRRWRYYAGAYSFEMEPPFKVRNITPPLLRGSLNDPTNFTPPNHAGLPLVVFPCGLLVDGDLATVSMGVNDSYSAIGRFHLPSLPWMQPDDLREPKTYYFHTTDTSLPPRASQIRFDRWTMLPMEQGILATINPVCIDDCLTRHSTVQVTRERFTELLALALPDQ